MEIDQDRSNSSARGNVVETNEHQSKIPRWDACKINEDDKFQTIFKSLMIPTIVQLMMFTLNLFWTTMIQQREAPCDKM